MRHFSLFFLALLLMASAKTQTIFSPNKQFKATFFLDKTGKPFYSLQFNGKTVIHNSALGLTIKKDSVSFLNGFVVKDTAKRYFNEVWSPVLGQYKNIKNEYNELAVTLEQPKQDRFIVIRFRLFDDGLGFRYEFPQQKNLNYFVITEEETQINLKEDYKAWWIAGDYDTEEYSYDTRKFSGIRANFSKGYEPGNVSASTIFMTMQTPLMLKSDDGLYINIHEAALIGYPAWQLHLDDTNFILKSHLTPDAQGNKAYIQTPFVTPWRSIVIAKKAEDILASSLILNLNEPTKFTDVSWIKPVKYIGVWWQMFVPNQGTWNYANVENVHLGITDYRKLPPNGTHAANNKNVMKYIDFAAKNGFDAVLVEGWNIGWEDWFGRSKEFVFDFVTPYPDFDQPFLTNYAKQKGVKLIMHHETSSSVTNYERFMDTAYEHMKKYGYDAVKSGYVGDIIPRGEHHYSQWMVQHYVRAIEKAAAKQIMVNSHESVHPTGLCRTFPNSIAAEAARGTEYEVFSGNNPEHTTILPFTRLMGGPMDYTPGIFQTKIDYYQPGDTRFVKTTLVKQLALYVTMYSSLQMAADLVENYERFPEPFQFIKDVAVDWDDTKILNAEPGDYIMIARKQKGSTNWFVGGITDENSREYVLKFDYLDPNTKYEATFYTDGADADYINNPQKYKIYKKVITNKSSEKIWLARSGGFAVSIKKLAN